MKVRYEACDGKLFDTEESCCLYELFLKPKSDEVITDVKSIILNIETTTGGNSMLIFRDIREPNISVNIRTKDMLIGNEIIKEEQGDRKYAIEFLSKDGGMVIV